MSLEDHFEKAFGHADPEHFAWQTSHSCVAKREHELLRAAFLPIGKRILDLGCGEGATLLHLGSPEGAIGVDLSEPKIAFARRNVAQCEFIAAAANHLPFKADQFDHLLIRDLIHHLQEPKEMLLEAWRVLEPGGRIDVLEPCRYNPLIALHALTTKAERGERRSTKAYLSQLLEPRFEIQSIHHYQAFPVHRVIYHPRLGYPSWVRRPWVRFLVNTTENIATRLMPQWSWSYIHLRAHKR